MSYDTYRNTHQDGERRMLTNEELNTVSGGEQAAPKALISVEIPGLSLNYYETGYAVAKSGSGTAVSGGGGQWWFPA